MFVLKWILDFIILFIQQLFILIMDGVKIVFKFLTMFLKLFVAIGLDRGDRRYR